MGENSTECFIVMRTYKYVLPQPVFTTNNLEDAKDYARIMANKYNDSTYKVFMLVEQ